MLESIESAVRRVLPGRVRRSYMAKVAVVYLVVLLVLGSVAVVQYGAFEQSVKADANDEYGYMATMQAEQVSTWLDEYYQVAGLMSQSSTFQAVDHDSHDDVNAYLAAEMARLPGDTLRVDVVDLRDRVDAVPVRRSERLGRRLVVDRDAPLSDEEETGEAGVASGGRQVPHRPVVGRDVHFHETSIELPGERDGVGRRQAVDEDEHVVAAALSPEDSAGHGVGVRLRRDDADGRWTLPVDLDVRPIVDDRRDDRFERRRLVWMFVHDISTEWVFRTLL